MPLQHYASYACAQFDSVQSVVERFLRDHHLPVPARMAFGIATAITGDQVSMTNHHWTFSIAALQAALGVERCLVLNDFTVNNKAKHFVCSSYSIALFI